MKHFSAIIMFLIIYVLLGTSVSSATPIPEGFVGVPWGSSQAQITQIMSERNWIKLTTSNPNEEVFKGFFDGKSCELHFVMLSNSFVEGYAFPIARFPVKNINVVKQEYESTVKHLTEKYGQPQQTGIVDIYKITYGPTTIWEFVDSVTSAKYTIRVIQMRDSIWFRDADGEQLYFIAVYEAVSLRERLKNKDL